MTDLPTSESPLLETPTSWPHVSSSPTGGTQDGAGHKCDDGAPRLRGTRGHMRCGWEGLGPTLWEPSSPVRWTWSRTQPSLCPRGIPLGQAAHHQPAWAHESGPWLQALPFLQDGDKLGEPVALHLGSLPEGLELRHLCLPAFLFRGVQEPGDQGGGRGQLRVT